MTRVTITLLLDETQSNVPNDTPNSRHNLAGFLDQMGLMSIKAGEVLEDLKVERINDTTPAA